MKKPLIAILAVSAFLIPLQAKAISWGMFSLILLVTGVNVVKVEYPEALYVEECLTDKNPTVLEKSDTGNYVYQRQYPCS